MRGAAYARPRVSMEQLQKEAALFSGEDENEEEFDPYDMTVEEEEELKQMVRTDLMTKYVDDHRNIVRYPNTLKWDEIEEFLWEPDDVKLKPTEKLPDRLNRLNVDFSDILKAKDSKDNNRDGSVSSSETSTRMTPKSMKKSALKKKAASKKKKKKEEKEKTLMTTKTKTKTKAKAKAKAKTKTKKRTKANKAAVTKKKLPKKTMSKLSQKRNLRKEKEEKKKNKNKKTPKEQTLSAAQITARRRAALRAATRRKVQRKIGEDEENVYYVGDYGDAQWIRAARSAGRKYVPRYVMERVPPAWRARLYRVLGVQYVSARNDDKDDDGDETQGRTPRSKRKSHRLEYMDRAIERHRREEDTANKSKRMMMQTTSSIGSKQKRSQGTINAAENESDQVEPETLSDHDIETLNTWSAINDSAYQSWLKDAKASEDIETRVLRTVLNDPDIMAQLPSKVVDDVRKRAASRGVTSGTEPKSFAQMMSLDNDAVDKVGSIDPYDGELKGLLTEEGSPFPLKPMKVPDVKIVRKDGKMKTQREIRAELNKVLNKEWNKSLGSLFGKKSKYPTWTFKALLTSLYENWRSLEEETVMNAQEVMEKEGLAVNRQGFMQRRPELITVEDFAAKNNVVPTSVEIVGIPKSMDVSAETLKKMLYTREGMRTNDEILEKDVKALTDTGYFSRVEIVKEDSRPLPETSPKFESLSTLGVAEHVNEVGKLVFKLHESKTKNRLKKFVVQGVFDDFEYADIEDQVLGKFKGSKVSGSLVYNSKRMLEEWFARKSKRPLSVNNGFCVTALHEKSPGELTAILQERPLPNEPRGTVLTDLVDPDEEWYDNKWKPGEHFPFWKVWQARRNLNKNLTRAEKEVMYYVGLGISKNVWYYKDRAGTTRGPCNMPIMRDAWSKGIIDADTLVYGTSLHFWTPIRNVNTLAGQIRTTDVIVSTALRRKSLEEQYKRVRKEREKAGLDFSDQGYKQVQSMV